MKKNKYKICLAAFAVAAFMFMLAGVNSAEDSDATPTKDFDQVEIAATDYSTLKYRLLTDTDGDYLQKDAKIAFVGINRDFEEKELKIPPKVIYNDVEYEVVGIRNNAFKANQDMQGATINPETSKLRFLETAIFPKTIQVIGVNASDEPSPSISYGGFSFSKCYNLKTIIFEEDSQLRHLSVGSFQDTAIESVDLTNCTKLEVLMQEVFGSKAEKPGPGEYIVPSSLKYVDIRGVTTVEHNAFRACNKITSIVMPSQGTIDNAAFPTKLQFYDDSGKQITEGKDLIGKAFKKNTEEKLVPAHFATFITNEGIIKDGDPLNLYYKDEPLPSAERKNVSFLYWEEYRGKVYDKMPGEDIKLLAIYKMELPGDVKITYDGYEHEYLVTGDYTIKEGAPGKNVGEYKFLIKPTEEYIVWDTGENTWNESWNVKLIIEKKQLTGISWTDPADMDLEYSQTAKEPGCKAEGLIGEDTVKVFFSLTDPTMDNTNVTDVPFTFTATGLDNDNYSLPDNCVSPGYTITAKDLSIKADDQEVKVGDPAAPFTVTTVGFVEGEDIKDLYGSLRIDCSYTTLSPEGSYSIVPSGVGSNNYRITFENGTLTAKGEQPDPPGPTPKPTPKPPVITVSVKIESSAGGHTSTDSLTVPLNSPVIVNGDKLIIGSSPGATVVRAVADIGYEFDSWSIEDGRILENTDIYATFKKVSLGGIVVKTYPQKMAYNEGDKFDPTGLSIQLTYSDGSAVKVDYEGNESDFSFSPSLDTPLKASDDKVIVTFMGQSAVIKISVSGAEDNTMMFIIVGVIAVIALVAIAAYLLRRHPAH